MNPELTFLRITFVLVYHLSLKKYNKTNKDKKQNNNLVQRIFIHYLLIKHKIKNKYLFIQNKYLFVCLFVKLPAVLRKRRWRFLSFEGEGVKITHISAFLAVKTYFLTNYHI